MKACLEYFRLMAIFRQMAVSAALPTCFHVTTNEKKCYQGLSGNVGLDFFSGFFFFNIFSEIPKSLSHDGCEIFVLDLLFFLTNAG